MRKRWLAIGLTISMLPTAVRAQPVELPTLPAALDGPTNQAVLLPPISDVPVKGPNNTRESYGEFSVSGGVLLLQPAFTANPAFTINNLAGKATSIVEFRQHLQASPDIWIGYTPERGWGVRGRWFQFNHDANANYTAAPGETIRGITSFPIGQTPVAGSIGANSNLAVNLFDLQLTRTCGGELWTHLFGIGARYVHMSQDYRANLTSPLTQIDLTSGHNLNGWGPSVTLATRRRFGASGFAIYGQTNFGLIFGQGNESSSAVQNGVRSQNVHGYTDVLPIGEHEVGIEYQHDLGRARLFLQTGFVGQIWFGAGNASNSDISPFSSSSDSNFGFLGLVVRGGVRYEHSLVPRLRLGTHYRAGSACHSKPRRRLAASAFPGRAWERECESLISRKLFFPGFAWERERMQSKG
jgi:hypothetical protein